MKINWAMFADYAAVQSNKITIVGGNWNYVDVPSFPATIEFYLVFSAHSEWSERRKDHRIVVEGVTVDGQSLFTTDYDFILELDPREIPGTPRYITVPLKCEIKSETPGTVVFKIRVDDDTCETVLNVRAM